MTRVGLTATAHYLPERVMSAAEVAAASGIPETVVVEKFGIDAFVRRAQAEIAKIQKLKTGG